MRRAVFLFTVLLSLMMSIALADTLVLPNDTLYLTAYVGNETEIISA